MKRIVLCADDYGQASSTSSAIMDLIVKKRISATSCIVTENHWPEHAQWLKPYTGKVDIGLHFNLTEGKPLSSRFKELVGNSFIPLNKLMGHCFLRNLAPSIVEDEFVAQFLRFSEAMGFVPNFIDGHQHIHQFPIIRDVIVKAHLKLSETKKTYIRWVNPMIWIDFSLKKLIIHCTGTKSFKQLLDKFQIKHNQTFSGIYNFAKSDSYSGIFPRFLQSVKDNGLIMCHPGSYETASDCISSARVQEYHYFLSDKFLFACKQANVCLSTFK